MWRVNSLGSDSYTVVRNYVTRVRKNFAHVLPRSRREFPGSLIVFTCEQKGPGDLVIETYTRAYVTEIDGRRSAISRKRVMFLSTVTAPGGK